MSYIIWNCQGAASKLFIRSLKLVISSYRPKILALIETKTSGSAAEAVCCKIGFDSWFRVEALGFSGVLCTNEWDDTSKCTRQVIK
ncbi:hypothetical protein M5689_000675 [Euphorbia peplus]|nr:hypothetical protein M5689_000675 [Euphorbia peplus]